MLFKLCIRTVSRILPVFLAFTNSYAFTKYKFTMSCFVQQIVFEKYTQ